MFLVDLFLVGLALSVLLLPVHVTVFWVQRRRGLSNGDSFRFSLLGVGLVFGFVFGVTAITAVANVGRDDLERSCADLDGQIHTFSTQDGDDDRICVVD